MENNKTNTKINKHTYLNISNRKKICSDGVLEVKRSNETEILIKLENTSLNIKGSNLNIIKIDIDTGILEAEGTIDNITYGNKQNLLKKLFK